MDIFIAGGEGMKCPWCGAENWEYLGFHGGFKEYKCRNCGKIIAFDHTRYKVLRFGQKFLEDFEKGWDAAGPGADSVPSRAL